ncbi:MAG TPA: PLP-dependent aminotransferase family protein [Tepidisphaeraceae bacterium]|nr:PLP-dependent aminotransferase family protein [Tepidisphaeraceae bacterium]
MNAPLPTPPLPLPLSAKALRTAESPINALIAAKLANPDLINFAAGLVDDASLPVDECRAITGRIFAEPASGRRALQYGTTIGLRALREELLAHLERLEGRTVGDLNLSPDDICVTTGSQQSLYLIADVLLNPGDIVITANPSYFVFTGALQSLGADVRAVPMDDGGMRVDLVEQTLADLDRSGELARVKFIYCTSYFDNPTGLSLAEARRKQLVEIVKRYSKSHRILILEDAAYRELRLDGPVLPSIKSFDPDNLYTIISLTFSKPFAPGIKLGYSVMPPDLLEQVLRQKGSHDFGTSNLCQEIALAALQDGTYLSHLDVLRDQYRKKRDATLAELEKHLGPKQLTTDHGQLTTPISWTHPAGGLYVWLTLPAHVDTSREGRLFDTCVKYGVLYVPGGYSFSPDATGRVPNHHVRLCYGQTPPADIAPGIERLADAIKAELAQ